MNGQPEVEWARDHKAFLAAKVLVTGASGFIGRHVCRALSQAGYTVVAHWHRSPPPEGLMAWHCDLIEAKTATDYPDCDAVIHLAGWSGWKAHPAEMDTLALLNLTITQRVAQAAAQKGAHFIYLSSAKVMGEWGEWYDDDPACPQDVYARSKLEAETLIRHLPGLRFTILRPPLIYGPGVKGNFLRLLSLADTRWPLPLADCSAPRSILSVTNLAGALLACLSSPASYGQTWLVADAAPSVAELLTQLRLHLGRPTGLWSVPVTWLGLLAHAVGRLSVMDKLCRPFLLHPTGIHEALGWVPLQPMSEALADTCGWYRKTRFDGR